MIISLQFKLLTYERKVWYSNKTNRHDYSQTVNIYKNYKCLKACNRRIITVSSADCVTV